jgi:hypothetical protein
MNNHMEETTIQKSESTADMKSQMKKWLCCTASIVGVIVLVLMCVYGKGIYARKVADHEIDQETYQVVKLKSGGSYFGKLSGLGKEYAIIEDTFYLQGMSPEVDENGNVIEEPEGSLPFTLQAAENQPYQPEGQMSIRTDDISNWQNLSEDSEVVKAIDEYLDSGKDEK